MAASFKGEEGVRLKVNGILLINNEDVGGGLKSTIIFPLITPQKNIP